MFRVECKEQVSTTVFFLHYAVKVNFAFSLCYASLLQSYQISQKNNVEFNRFLHFLKFMLFKIYTNLVKLMFTAFCFANFKGTLASFHFS